MSNINTDFTLSAADQQYAIQLLGIGESANFARTTLAEENLSSGLRYAAICRLMREIYDEAAPQDENPRFQEVKKAARDINELDFAGSEIAVRQMLAGDAKVNTEAPIPAEYFQNLLSVRTGGEKLRLFTPNGLAFLAELSLQAYNHKFSDTISSLLNYLSNGNFYKYIYQKDYLPLATELLESLASSQKNLTSEFNLKACAYTLLVLAKLDKYSGEPITNILKTALEQNPELKQLFLKSLEHLENSIQKKEVLTLLKAAELTEPNWFQYLRQALKLKTPAS